MRHKKIRELLREFRVYDEDDKLIYVSDSASDIASKLNTSTSYIFKYKNTDEYFSNNKYQNKMLKISYVKTYIEKVEPFVIPEDKVQDIKNKPDEVWKVIPGVPSCNYASSYGRFKVVDLSGNEMLLNALHSKNSNGRTYHDYNLINPDGNNIRVRASRALAKTFIDESFPLFYTNGNKVVVDHINNDSTDDKISNLRIITQSQNIQSAIYDHKKVFGRPKKKVMCIETGQTFESAADAARFYNLHPVVIANAINPNQVSKTAAGYTWKYID
jgi:hypothetical protein